MTTSAPCETTALRSGRRPSRIVCLALVGLGFSVSGYLLARTLALLDDRALGAWDVCSFVFHGSCDARLLDAESWKFGIPLAGWGIVYYSALGFILALGWMLGETFENEARLGALALSIAGGCLSLVLIGTM